MERRLVRLERVGKIQPIYSSLEPLELAHSIEQVMVGGWRLVAKKGEFTEGGFAVFFEIDSVLPGEFVVMHDAADITTDPVSGNEMAQVEYKYPWVHQWAAFMKDRDWRVRTLKLNKFTVEVEPGVFVPVVSQGLALPVDLLEGLDLTAAVGVTKHLSQAEKGGKGSFKQGRPRGNFPDFIPKTDEIRVQSVMAVLDEIAGKHSFITMKLDGSSMTVYYDNRPGRSDVVTSWLPSEEGMLEDGTAPRMVQTQMVVNDPFHVCSRNNDKLREPEIDTFWKTAVAEKLEEKLKDYPLMAVQGEMVGPGIQQNRLGLDQFRFYAFNVYNIQTGRYLDYPHFIKFCDDLGIRRVPVIEEVESWHYGLRDLEKLVDRNYPGTEHPMEGVVVRPAVEQYSRALRGRLSFKLVNEKYLLKIKD